MVSCRSLQCGWGPLTAHSDTPALPRRPWRTQKYTVPVSAIVCRIPATYNAQQRGRVPIPMSIRTSELGRRERVPAPDLDRQTVCEADRQGQPPTHVKLQPCKSCGAAPRSSLPTCQAHTAYGGGAHRRHDWPHNSAYGKDVGGHVLQGTA